MLRRTLLPLLALSAIPACAGDLFEGFAEDWRKQWEKQRLFSRPTDYEVTRVDGAPVLRARSRNANSGLLRPVHVAKPRTARLTWRWAVTRPLVNTASERTRAGDDYAARVFVVFETSTVPLRNRAINYVWAACEPTGTVFASPYSANVAMFVLRSAADESKGWHTEERDVLADYRRFFGEDSTEISAVAILSDTDNTDGEAEALFADLRLASDPAHR